MATNERIFRAVDEIVRAAHSLEQQGLSVDEILDAAHAIRGNTLMGSLPEPEVLRDLSRLLKHLGLDYALIGGIAVAVHGQERATGDIDVLVSRLPSNEKTSDVDFMRQFNFYRGRSTTGKHMVLDHHKGQVELLPADDKVRRWAVSTAQPEMVLRHKVPVVTPEALIALKLKAMSSNPNRKQDAPDVLSILQVNPIADGVLDQFLTKSEQEKLKTLMMSLT